mmetsp:Transcript_42337/g.101987  ORF Transcript_42337/g.101987 Transcript_42337/m.101987 type:complete len:933 (+) Transcript_42337:388-3186(+)
MDFLGAADEESEIFLDEEPSSTMDMMNNATDKTNTTFSDSSDGDDYYDDFAFFSRAQYIVLFAVAFFSCVLSICGSVLILYLVLKGKRYKDGGLYHRLLLGLSVSDLVVTFSLILQPFLTPEQTGYPFSRGNATTCAVVGFGYLYFVGSYTYNCLLGLYFLLTVRYRMTQRRIARYIEPWGHILAFTFPTAIGISAVMFELLNANPFLGICNLFPSQHECEWHENSPDIECENQKQYNILNSMLDYYALVTAGVGLICTVVVYVTVKTRYNKALPARSSTTPLSQTFSMITMRSRRPSSAISSIRSDTASTNEPHNRDEGKVNTDDTGSVEVSDSEPELDSEVEDSENTSAQLKQSEGGCRTIDTEKAEADSIDEGQRKRLQQIGMQAVWYAAAYMIGLLVVLAANIIDTIYLDPESTSSDLTTLGEKPLFFFFTLLIWMFFPLQGFFNGMIYIRPRLVRWKHHFQGCSWWFAFRMVLTNEPPPRWGEKSVVIHQKSSDSMGMATHHSPRNTRQPKEVTKSPNKKKSSKDSSPATFRASNRHNPMGALAAGGILYQMPQLSSTTDGESDIQRSSRQNPAVQVSGSYWKKFEENSPTKGFKQQPRRVTFSSITFADGTVSEFNDSETEEEQCTRRDSSTRWQAEQSHGEPSEPFDVPAKDASGGGLNIFSRWHPNSSSSNASSSKSALKPPRRPRSSFASSLISESSLGVISEIGSPKPIKINDAPEIPIRQISPLSSSGKSKNSSPPRLPVRIASKVESEIPQDGIQSNSTSPRLPVRVASVVESETPQSGMRSNGTAPRLPVRAESKVESEIHQSPSQSLKMPIRLDSDVEEEDEISPLPTKTAPSPSIMAMWKPIGGKKMSSDWGALSIGIDDDREGETAGSSSQRDDNAEAGRNSKNNVSPTAMWRPIRGKAESSDWGAISIGGLVDDN